MKKIFANILIVTLIVAPVLQATAQNVQKQAAKPKAAVPKTTCAVVKNAKPISKPEKAAQHNGVAKAQNINAKPTSVTTAKKLEPPKQVSEKIKEEERKVAAAKQAHEAKMQKPESKAVAAAPEAVAEAATEKPVQKYDSTLCFPLKRDNIYSLYTFVIDLRDKKIISKYKPFFDRNNYQFTGYVWQSLLKQMINNADDKIMHNVFIKAEDNLVCFTITSYDVKTELPEYICPILSSPQQFAAYVRKVDRQDVNNY